MKKLALLFVSVLTIGLTSCSSDDKVTEASFEGKWEYSQQGTVIAGQEVLTVYPHTQGCPKDYLQINATTSVDHKFTTDECLEDTTTRTYTRNGNTISTTAAGQTITGEIVNLTETTLKLKSSQTVQGQTLSYIVVYTRA